MLKLEHVKKEYQNFTLDCSFQLEPGRVVGLIGANGAGKSTAFKALLGLIQIDGGKIQIFGKPLEEIGTAEKERMGVVLADSGVSGYLTVDDLIPVFDNLYQKFDKTEFVAQCERFQIPRNKLIKEFSTGMKRKLHLLIAMSHEADLLVLDEPTAGLDVIAREEILEMLQDYMEEGERGILISSHISSDLEGLCDEIYMIDKGKIILHEETDVLLDEYGILKVTEETYQNMDQTYIIRKKPTDYGYMLWTNQKQYYMETYPEMVIEKGNIDELMTMMIRGEK